MTSQASPAGWRIQLRDLVASLLLFAALGSACVEAHLRGDWMSGLLIEGLNIREVVPIADDLHQDVWQYYFQDDPLLEGEWKQKEIHHLADVKHILKLNRTFAWVAGAFSCLLMLFSERWRWLRMAFGWMLGIGGGLLLLSTHWILFFRGVHPLFFSGDSWDFNIHAHVIVRLYPDAYITWQAGAIIATVLAGGLFFRLLAWRYEKNPPAPDWRWRAMYTGWIVAACLLAWPGWQLGRHLYSRHSPGMYYYYVIVVLMLAGGLAFWALEKRARGLAIVISALLLLHPVAFGVKAGYQAAVAATHQAQPILNAVERFKKAENCLPESLEELKPEYLPVVPPLNAGADGWRYDARRNRYVLWFSGPLEAVFEYHSETGKWYFPPIP